MSAPSDLQARLRSRRVAALELIPINLEHIMIIVWDWGLGIRYWGLGILLLTMENQADKNDMET